MTRFRLARLAACSGLFFAAGCSDSSTAPAPLTADEAHTFSYDAEHQTYLVHGKPVAAADVRRDLVGNVCGKCHENAVDEVKASVHYTNAGRTSRVWFPGGGAHGMLDRACGLPATTGLTNHFSDINLGECAKCHVGRFQPMMEGLFASQFQQMGVPDAAAQAARIVDGGIDCLICHSESYRSVPQDGTLAAIAASSVNDPVSPNAVGSARASRDNTDFDQNGSPDLLIDMDGDGVPDAPLMYDSNGDGTPDTPFATVAQDRGPAAMGSVGRTTEHNCLRCHEHARSGYKRGTLFDADHDVHAAAVSGPFALSSNRCTVCHTSEHHRFVRGNAVGGDIAASDHPVPLPGAVPDPTDSHDVTCRHCHDTDHDPVLQLKHNSMHLEKIACETCHIPMGSGLTYSLFGNGGQVSFSRNAAGKDTKLVVADVYLAGNAADLQADVDAYRVDPTLVWFDGGTSFLAQTLSVRTTPNAKITPFKPMGNGMIFDARFFAGTQALNAANVPYNAYSMYRFFANGNNAEVFSALGMIDMAPADVRNVSLADFSNPSRDAQAMALMLLFPNLVYFDKATFGYEHYLTRNGSPFDANGDGIVDFNTALTADLLAAANAGLQRFAGFNAPMGLPATYEWYPAFTQPSDLISMKLPDGSEIKMFLQMQANQLPEPQRTEMLSAVQYYPSFSQITLGGHGVAPKARTIGATGCRECHAPNGILARPVPVGRRTPTNLGPMGTIELPVYQWKYYHVRNLIDLGLTVQCEDILAGTANVDVDGNTTYLRESSNQFVVNWFAPETPGGYRRADDATALAGTSLTANDLTWNGGAWMPVLEPVTDMVPNWQVLGLPSSVIWP